MKIGVWFDLAEYTCRSIEELGVRATKKNEMVNDLIKKVSMKISEQWASTHNTAIKQVEDGLVSQGILLKKQYDV